jgi:hypothetical protein
LGLGGTPHRGSITELMSCNGRLWTPDCERVRPTGIAQPMNSATSRAYLPASLDVFIAARRTAGPMRVTLTVYAAALTATGVGSVAYHGRRLGRMHHIHDGSLQVTLALAFGLLTHIVLNGEVRWRNPYVRRLLVLAMLAAGAFACAGNLVRPGGRSYSVSAAV